MDKKNRVVMMDPASHFESSALMSTDVNLSAITIIEAFVKRWAIEITFREVREHLGVETQRLLQMDKVQFKMLEL